MQIFYRREENLLYDELYRSLRAALLASPELAGDPSDEAIRSAITGLVNRAHRENYLPIGERTRISRELFYSVRRLDILQDLVDDPDISEIMVNGPDRIFVEKGGVLQRLPRGFSSPEKLDDVIQQIVSRCNRVINERSPVVDARLPDGSRVNAVISPAAINGPILTIRRFPKEPITMDKLVRLGSLTEEAACFLEDLVRAGYSSVISGGTSAGKTTFLNALSNYIPKDERIITIEDNAELQLQGIDNLVCLEAKMSNMEGNTEITIRDLIRASLRMRPDRIIVGEVRGGEAADMLQCFNTGHEGSSCSIHANSCHDAISRLETMVIMALPIPLAAIRRQIASGIDILVHLGRLRDGKRRVLEIAEVDGMGEEEVRIHSLFLWDDRAEVLRKTGELANTLRMERMRKIRGSR